MEKELRTAVYDEDLRIEAYRFAGLAQPFPEHFHEYYVVGLVENGSRRLPCRGREYMVSRGDILFFCPGDNHTCVQTGYGRLDYRGLNISGAVMLALAEEVTGKREFPAFEENVIRDEDAADCLRCLHEGIMTGLDALSREENLLLLLSLLIRKYGKALERPVPVCREEIERACGFMQANLAQRISLEQICRHAGLSKSTLLRAFTKAKGITPYRYLENIRVGRARELLEQGASPLEAAMETGFSDQSHFTNYFRSFIGLSPGAYRDIFRSKKEM